MSFTTDRNDRVYYVKEFEGVKYFCVYNNVDIKDYRKWGNNESI